MKQLEYNTKSDMNLITITYNLKTAQEMLQFEEKVHTHTEYDTEFQMLKSKLYEEDNVYVFVDNILGPEGMVYGEIKLFCTKEDWRQILQEAFTVVVLWLDTTENSTGE